MDKQLTAIRAALIGLSLIATFFFLVGMGSGFGAVLFATGGTLTQAAALLYLPDLMFKAWDNNRLIVSGLSGSALAVVVLISVAGSASILSGLTEESAQVASKRAGLVALAQAKQESADRLIALDRITKAQPLLKEVEELNARISELPTPSGFYLAAQRIGGTRADSLISTVILALSLLLDGVALLLGIESRPETVEVITEPDPERDPALEYKREVLEIRKAIQEGELNAPSVRSVRALLGCSQNKAVEIAKLCRAADEQMALL